MGIASNLVDAFVKAEKERELEGAAFVDVGSGIIAVTPEMARQCVEQGIGKIVERPKGRIH